MRWASHSARFARCRNAHLSAFARQANMGLQGHRAMSSCAPLTRLCAEVRPPQGFVEQRAKTPGALSRLTTGEGLEEMDAATQQMVAEMIEAIVATFKTGGCSLSEIFDIGMTCRCLHWTCYLPKAYQQNAAAGEMCAAD
mmetsp:Transcript_15/g.53  ORF Transcript_15/g.53 Transcript_15/m.53 type:complete len:140 (-) Transcript_15:123-542(-)